MHKSVQGAWFFWTTGVVLPMARALPSSSFASQGNLATQDAEERASSSKEQGPHAALHDAEASCTGQKHACLPKCTEA